MRGGMGKDVPRPELVMQRFVEGEKGRFSGTVFGCGVNCNKVLSSIWHIYLFVRSSSKFNSPACGHPANASADAIVTTWPWSRRTISGKKALTVQKCARRFTSTPRRISRSERSRIVLPATIPAMLMRIVGWPI